MKLNELVNKSLFNLLADMDIVKISPCSDDSGEIEKIVIEYVPKDNSFKPHIF